MCHVARPAAQSVPAVLFLLLLSLACAHAPLPDDELEVELAALREELRVLRHTAWDAQRQAHRAQAFAELAEEGAAEAGEAWQRAERIRGAWDPGQRPAVERWLRDADRVLVLKGERRLELYRGEELLREFRIALGFAPEGHKERQGDGRTPEGVYTLDGRVHTTRFGRALHISYPRPQDQARARANGVEPGGGIFIHGLPRGLGPIIGAAHARFDWTDGCIAVTDEELAELWARVPEGTPIEILP